ncbi:hypothetical protein, variant [Aphanomyces invadans]|uniref:DIX domain-containing protein n=1 Tax=Aphanomyces invadans TaxID=157072 RepID=A0A024UWP0_9STRA|nr:hypothetical protein, variant [Aphanomyces invadans]ETW10357.1 hypothetical protein, variant [Aphanomyces invadans]|eukprot:XP_008861768.1 hypothetical protein, variant [Aphanomyces invadans]
MEGMINYFIPDDGDTPDHLNVFPIPSQHKSNLKLAHIKKEFPIPGKFHFRFKQAFEGTYVWLDVNDDDPVPDFNGLIISKISRISDVEVPAQHTSTSSASSKSAASSPPCVQTDPSAVPDLIQTNVSTPKAVDTAPKVFNDDLVGLMSTPITSQSPRGPAIANPSPSAQSQQPGDAFDVFAGANPTIKPPTPRGAMGGAPSPMNPPPSGSMNQFNNLHGGQFSMGGPPQPQQGFNLGRPPMMNQMNPSGMGQMGRPPPMQQNANGFNNLQWQGMNPMQQQQQQQRPPTGQPPRQNW